MMRVAVFLSAVAMAFAECDTPTCYKCQAMAGCGWYTAGSLANCYKTTAVPAGLNFTLTANNSCPTCQAGNCLDCAGPSQPAAAGTCGWYANSVGAIGGTCALANNTPSSTIGTYSLKATNQSSCPACTSFTGCAQCTANEANQTCGWYSLAGVSDGKCAEASPGFLWTKTNAAFCSGNICAGATNCSLCLAANANETNCAWYTPPTPLSAFYNPKCDINGTGIVDNALYNPTFTCPPCQSSTCQSCQADSTCQWVGISALGNVAFGQCVTSGTNVAGKSVVSTCPAACELYSCSQCVAASACRWFSNAGQANSGFDDTCARTEDGYLHGLSKTISTAGTCPACRATRCYECNMETTNNCQWYAATLLGKIVIGTDSCGVVGKAPTLGPTAIATTDARCKGNPNSAALALPGLAFVAALFV